MWLQLHLRHFCFNHLIIFYIFPLPSISYIYVLELKMCGDKEKVRGYIIIDWD